MISLTKGALILAVAWGVIVVVGYLGYLFTGKEMLNYPMEWTIYALFGVTKKGN